MALTDLQKADWLQIHWEEGDYYAEDGGGPWFSRRLLNRIRDNEDIEARMWNEKHVLSRVEESDKPFRIMCYDVSFVVEEPSWTVDGYDIGAAWLEWELVEIVEYE